MSFFVWFFASFCEIREVLKGMRDRREYKRQWYLKKEVREADCRLSRELATQLIKQQEHEKQLRLDRNKIWRHNQWLKRYLRTRPGLQVVFTDWSFEEKKVLLKASRRRAFFLLENYEKNHKHTPQHGGLYNEVLWRPKRCQKNALISRRDFWKPKRIDPCSFL
jgi:hypothetical protein